MAQVLNQWTHERPTKPGWYWLRTKVLALFGEVRDHQQIVMVDSAGKSFSPDLLDVSVVGKDKPMPMERVVMDAQWCGPLNFPHVAKSINDRVDPLHTPAQAVDRELRELSLELMTMATPANMCQGAKNLLGAFEKLIVKRLHDPEPAAPADPAAEPDLMKAMAQQFSDSI